MPILCLPNAEGNLDQDGNLIISIMNSSLVYNERRGSKHVFVEDCTFRKEG